MLSGINILVAEDNKLNQKIAFYILQKQNAIVTMVLNGKEAIELISKNQYDLVLMDLHMPVMDGYEATLFIRNKLKKTIPIVALTASISADESGECISIGMNACISKPFDPEALCELILKLTKENKSGIK